MRRTEKSGAKAKPEALFENKTRPARARELVWSVRHIMASKLADSGQFRQQQCGD